MSAWRRGAVQVVSWALAGCMGATAVTVRAPVPRQCDAVRDAVGSRVRWYHPVEPRDNQRLDDWCRAVGPVVIDSLPDGSFASSGLGDSLAIATWNVDAGSGYLVAFLQERLGLVCDGSRSLLAGDALHFVLMVQEALRRSNLVPDVAASWAIPAAVSETLHPGERLDVIEVAAACGLAVFYVPAARNGIEPRDGLREDKGNAILSTLPLSDFVAIELPFEASRRVVPVASVHNHAGDALRVASVHLVTTPPPWRIVTTGNSAHARQAIALTSAFAAIDESGDEEACAPAECDTVRVDTRRAAGPPTLVAGDMNTTSVRETALRFLRSEFPESPTPLPGGSRGRFPTDHLFFRRGATGGVSIPPASYRRIENTYYSDHKPVFAVITFREP